MSKPKLGQSSACQSIPCISLIDTPSPPRYRFDFDNAKNDDLNSSSLDFIKDSSIKRKRINNLPPFEASSLLDFTLGSSYLNVLNQNEPGSSKAWPSPPPRDSNLSLVLFSTPRAHTKFSTFPNRRDNIVVEHNDTCDIIDLDDNEPECDKTVSFDRHSLIDLESRDSYLNDDTVLLECEDLEADQINSDVNTTSPRNNVSDDVLYLANETVYSHRTSSIEEDVCDVIEIHDYDKAVPLNTTPPSFNLVLSPERCDAMPTEESRSDTYIYGDLVEQDWPSFNSVDRSLLHTTITGDHKALDQPQEDGINEINLNTVPKEKTKRNKTGKPAKNIVVISPCKRKKGDNLIHPKLIGMSTPTMVKEASKYGVKKLAKSKLVKILTAIYEHFDNASTSSKSPANELQSSPNLDSAYSSIPNSQNISPPCAQSFHPLRDHKTPDKAILIASRKDPKKAGADISPSEIVIDESPPPLLKRLGKGSQDILKDEASFYKDTHSLQSSISSTLVSPLKVVKAKPIKLHKIRREVSDQIMKDFIQSDHELYGQILCYEPLCFDYLLRKLNETYLTRLGELETLRVNEENLRKDDIDFKANTTAYVIYKKCSRVKLVQFLDAYCITFKFRKIGDWNHKPRRGRRKK